MRHNLIDRLKEEWAQLEPVDPLRGLISDAIDALQRKPLTDEQRRETISRAWNDYLRGEGDDSFGWYLSQAIEAAHGITGEQP